MTCTRFLKSFVLFSTMIFGIALAQGNSGGAGDTTEPIVLQDQGAYAFGGTILGDFEESSIHCDHGYVEYQIPVNARDIPLLMYHSSSTKTWETTFGGGEGYKNIFLRRGFAEYIIDPPRLGRAGWSCQAWSYEPDLGRDQGQITSWRLGTWDPPNPPEYWPGVQFPVDDPEAMDEVLRARYPEFNDPEAVQVETTEVAKLVDEIGSAIVITHSGSGIRGWWTALKSDNVAAIIAYEPSDFVFPEGTEPAYPTEAPVPEAEFEKLTQMPIQIIYGDNIPDAATGTARDSWFEARENAKLFVEQINEMGGDAELVSLPDIGITGNTHFPMSDLNNVEIADLLSEYLQEKGLDQR
jgi:hypothetical protein